MEDLPFHLHPFTIVSIVIAWLIYPLLCSIGDSQNGHSSLNVRFKRGRSRPSSKQRRFFHLGLASLFVANFWPLSDLAQHYLLLARITQQMLITLCAVPLFLLSIPKVSIVALTRPRYIDLALATLTRPIPAVLLFSVGTFTALTPAAVRFEASGVLNQQLIQAFLFIISTLVWMPILRILPGVRQLSTAGRLAFVFVLSLVPSVPSIILIFAKRALYPTYIHSALGIGPVGDQELSGALAKIISLAVFWGIAVAILLKTNKDEELGLDPDPITWDDVQRELDRSSKRYPSS